MEEEIEALEATLEIQDAVAFIDEWLEANAFAADARAVDFALDLRLLLTGAGSEAERRFASAGV